MEFGDPQVTSCVDSSIAFEQGKLWCIPPIIIDFSFNLYNYVLLDCAFKFIGIE
jgi:hypothetical protein